MNNGQNTGNKPRFTPLAIIGMGCLFPKADSLEAYWANIKSGTDAITEVPPTHWNPEELYDPDPPTPDKVYGKRGGFLSPVDFNPMEFGILPNALEATDTSQLLGLVAAGQALRDAGYGADRDFDRSRISVLLGVTGTLELVIPLGARLGHPIWRRALKEAGVDNAVAEDVVSRIADSYVPWQETSFPGLLGNVVAGRISKHYNLLGTNSTVDAACGSSLSAVHLAAMELATGSADIVVTGGVDTFNDIFMFTCFSKTPALSPTGNAKPFDADGDGTILGEGLGIVVLKRLEDAERDGDRIYAVIKGIGTSSDGKGGAIYEPSAQGQERALRAAYENAQIDPSTIGLVEAHGTGTKVGDAVEVSALRNVYGESETPYCALGSIKAQIGHTKAAAGSAGLIKAALALHHKVLPPTIKVKSPNEAVTKGKTPFYLSTEKRPWLASESHPRRAAVSAFGFGGSNFHCVLEEHAAEKSEVDWDGSVQLFTLCAADRQALSRKLDALSAAASWDAARDAAARCRNDFDPSANCRLAFVVEKDGKGLKAAVESARAMLAKNDANAWTTPDGISFASGAQDGKVAFLFPGQGAQYTGMLRDLASQFPEFFEAVSEADRAFRKESGRAQGLGDLIYPAPSFDTDVRAKNEAALRSTDVAQPAIGAVSLGALRVLERFGLRADAVAGHSYGELTALCAAGRIDAATLNRLSVVRGRLMAGDGEDRGTMLAVSASLADLEKVVAEEKLDLVIANRNAPAQAVLSGSRIEIARATECLSKRGLAAKEIPVAAAFHSPLVADAAEPFAAEVRKATIAGGTCPVYANTTASEYPAQAKEAAELLGFQLARPVEFVAEIEALYAAGVRTFVEIGPGARLVGLVKAILGDRDHTAVAVDASSGKRSGIADLGRALAQIAASGHAVNLSEWDGGHAPLAQETGKKPGMTVPICGANYMKPRPKRPSRPAAPVQTAVTAPQAPATPPLCADLPAQALVDALRVSQQSMAALQQLQEQTAQLHQKFLEGQEAVSRSFATLVTQQGQLFGGAVPANFELPTLSTPVATPPAIQTPAPAPVKAQPAPQAAAAPAVDTGRAAQVLLDVIAEKTGYPAEMLELDMSLDADLGIDSIKRVEILSALQEKLPEAPPVKPEHLGTLQTLRHIVDFLGQRAQAAAQVQTAHAAPAVDTGRAAQVLLDVIAEKTGYPVDMLELDMALDADLGIDSIKRVEILSALQEKLPEAPPVKPEHLGTLQTLRHIVDFLGQGTQAAAPVQTAPAAPAVDSGRAAQVLLDVIAEKTGYPVDMLELDMALDADLGIDSIKRVEILSTLQEKLPEAPPVKPEHLGTLQTLRHIVDFLGQGTQAAAPLKPSAEATGVTEPAPRRGIERSVLKAVTLPPAVDRKALPLPSGLFAILDDGSGIATALATQLEGRNLSSKVIGRNEIGTPCLPDDLAGLILPATAPETDDAQIMDAFRLLQAASSNLRRTANALLVTVSRLDGAFGLASGSNVAVPLSGGITGLAKTAGHEWKEVRCRAFDLAGDFTGPDAAASAVVAEMLVDGPVETGLAPSGATSLELAVEPIADGGKLPLSEGDVVVITGGARGVTAEIADALSGACRPTLVLFGRSGLPADEPAWLAGVEGEAAIKKALMQNGPKGMTPKDLQAEYEKIAGTRELRLNLRRMENSGGKVVYRAVDVRDTAALKTALDAIREEFGPVRGIVHGAGVLADRLIEDKTVEQFESVYKTKVEGIRNLLQSLPKEDLRAVVLFSSSTGRFGRTGQVDYAVANEILNKEAQSLSRALPACRVVSVNWGPWEGGMVTPSLRKVFESEGIGLIGLREGAEYLLQEISLPSGSPAEVVILAEGSSPAVAPHVDTTPATPLATALEFEVGVASHPFLASHVMNGKAVLPMAMMIEWMGQGAVHANPGLHFHGLDGLRVLKGLILEKDESRRLRIKTAKASKKDGLFILTVELATVTAEGDEILHARGTVILAGALPAPAQRLPQTTLAPYGAAEIYTPERLFHGPKFRAIEKVEGCDASGIAVLLGAMPQPIDWIAHPLRSRWLTAPLCIDAAFQAMILWSVERHGAPCLPCHAGRYRQFRAAFPEGPLSIRARITSDRPQGATAGIDFVDASGELIARIDGYECVIDPSLAAAFSRNSLAHDSASNRGAA